MDQGDAKTPTAKEILKNIKSNSRKGMRVSSVLQQLGNLDEDNLAQSEMEILKRKENDELSGFKAVSYLPPSMIRWIDKHKPPHLSAPRAHVAPSRAMQLRAIFRGLDFDNSGELSLEELKEAVNYVASSGPVGSSDPIFESPTKLNKFFDDMDLDGNGTVDFNEFLIAMTSESGATGDDTRLQNAFYEFANKHRRQKIVDRINDESVPTLERFDEFKKLARIKFIKDDAKDDKTLQDPLQRVAEEAQMQRREMNSGLHLKKRKLERSRSRLAALKVKYSKAPLILSPLMTTKAEVDLDGEDASIRDERITREITRNLSNFSLHDKVDYYPSMTSSKSLKDLKMDAVSTSMQLKKAGLTKSCLLPPPLSMKNLTLHRLEASRPAPKVA